MSLAEELRWEISRCYPGAPRHDRLSRALAVVQEIERAPEPAMYYTREVSYSVEEGEGAQVIVPHDGTLAAWRDRLVEMVE